MNAMRESLRGYLLTLLALWTALALVAIFYSQLKDIPLRIAAAALPVFLLEATFYVSAGLEDVRHRFERLGPLHVLAAWMTLSAVIPYCLYALFTGTFRGTAFLELAGVAALASFWFLVAGKSIAADLGFLALMAAVYVAKLFPHIFIDVTPKLPANVLGTAMWIRTGLLAMLSIRKMDGIGFGFWPSRREWKIGIVHFLLFLPIGFILGTALKFLHPKNVTPAWKTTALVLLTFFGTLWVLAALEEVFFRGLLQQMLCRRFRSDIGGLVVTSIIFGSAHLGFRHFPNWTLAIIATVLGLFCGSAYLRSGSVRASMVTHALTVTIWKVFLS
jgi:membrane protease YdiL (CAAX protease family)